MGFHWILALKKTENGSLTPKILNLVKKNVHAVQMYYLRYASNLFSVGRKTDSIPAKNNISTASGVVF